MNMNMVNADKSEMLQEKKTYMHAVGTDDDDLGWILVLVYNR
jgi:hypothetical protein